MTHPTTKVSHRIKPNGVYAIRLLDMRKGVKWLTFPEVTHYRDKHKWVDDFRRAVRFAEGVEKIWIEPYCIGGRWVRVGTRFDINHPDE